MKKLVIISLLIFTFLPGLTFSQTTNSYPIPSFNIEISGNAYFEESAFNLSPKDESKGRRVIKAGVQNTLMNFGTTAAVVWFYSLDKQDILGPFELQEGDVVSLEIDDRLWGSRIIPDSEMVVSVWID
jgi:hypothetical protein